jgi:hypothetical protein
MCVAEGLPLWVAVNWDHDRKRDMAGVASQLQVFTQVVGSAKSSCRPNGTSTRTGDVFAMRQLGVLRVFPQYAFRPFPSLFLVVDDSCVSVDKVV